MIEYTCRCMRRGRGTRRYMCTRALLVSHHDICRIRAQPVRGHHHLLLVPGLPGPEAELSPHNLPTMWYSGMRSGKWAYTMHFFLIHRLYF